MGWESAVIGLGKAIAKCPGACLQCFSIIGGPTSILSACSLAVLCLGIAGFAHADVFF